MTGKAPNDLSGVARLYEDSLEKHGTAPMGVGWRDEGSHVLRFDRLVSVIDKGDPVTINDLGCGYGSLYDHLTGAGTAIRGYRGYDISEKMLAEARRALPGDDSIELIHGATLSQVADYSFASGIFNVLLEQDEDGWREHVLATIANMAEFSSRGFAFNLLSTYVDFREDHLYYGDPLFFFDHCKRTFSRFVSLLHDYPLYEWTITVRK